VIKQRSVPTPTEGGLLIAPPSIRDPHWAESVILLGQHGELGSQGWMFNRPTGHRVSEVVKGLDIDLDPELELFWGGPLATHTLWLLHSAEWTLANTQIINDQWAATSNDRMFHYLTAGSVPQYYRVIMGHCSWSPGQLQDEILGTPPRQHSQSWLLLNDPDQDWLFEQRHTELWREALNQSVDRAVQQLF
jgi:putative transcriptional regulator